MFDPAQKICADNEEESVGEPEIIEEEVLAPDISALQALFPNFPSPKFSSLVDCYFGSSICNPVVVNCIPKKNRNGCAVKTINFYEKIGEI